MCGSIVPSPSIHILVQLATFLHLVHQSENKYTYMRKGSHTSDSEIISAPQMHSNNNSFKTYPLIFHLPKEERNQPYHEKILILLDLNE